MREPASVSSGWLNRLRRIVIRLGVGLLARLLGTADARTVGQMAARELSLILRSGNWHRFLFMWALLSFGILAFPLLYRSYSGSWLHPTNTEWLVLCGYAMQVALFVSMANWCIRRLRRDLYTNRLDELMLTRCSPADIAMGEALASAIASAWVVVISFPVCLMLSAMAGHGWVTAVELLLSLLPVGGLGVWFGMGWGLAFTLRRPQAMVGLTQWWFLGPFLPIWLGWSAIGFIGLLWALVALLPGGFGAIRGTFLFMRWVANAVVLHWNPLLTAGATVHMWKSTWVTDWLALVFILCFMMRKSMDTVQNALATLPERGATHGSEDQWIHHDVHYFMQYGESKRREPKYRDGGNAIAAFDTALGHRVYLHPIIWTVAIMAYLFLLVWSLMVPQLGKGTAIAAVLIPATGALLLMSGGVAVSFAWERDRHRWQPLAMLPMSDFAIAFGKIKGAVRPTLWVSLVSSSTALLMGWRGAIPAESALWMALHVLVFPVALACVSAVLALTTRSLEEAIYKWAVLGAIPTFATVLPWPIGGEGGLAIAFSPPLLALLIVVEGPTQDLVRASWLSLGFQLGGMIGALLILDLLLRRWTMERD